MKQVGFKPGVHEERERVMDEQSGESEEEEQAICNLFCTISLQYFLRHAYFACR